MNPDLDRFAAVPHLMFCSCAPCCETRAAWRAEQRALFARTVAESAPGEARHACLAVVDAWCTEWHGGPLTKTELDRAADMHGWVHE